MDKMPGVCRASAGRLIHVAAHTAASTAILAYAARDEAGVEGFGLDCLEGPGRRKEIPPRIQLVQAPVEDGAIGLNIVSCNAGRDLSPKVSFLRLDEIRLCPYVD